ncbi:MAG: hypothetical protein A3F22_03920 [Candidatus Magasanikbacteria bacterium RIFCSPHIGHO2_12_FULL_41_16]|nr:MAG: hypothetical protein A3F22_03920 [Candidatus Magasanikbacteria bacterium RIFCSPHIGHO2_12_FULL_41_16]
MTTLSWLVSDWHNESFRPKKSKGGRPPMVGTPIRVGTSWHVATHPTALTILEIAAKVWDNDDNRLQIQSGELKMIAHRIEEREISPREGLQQANDIPERDEYLPH